MKQLLLLVLVTGFCVGCTNDSVVITGKVKNYDGNAIILEKKVGLIYRELDTLFIKKDSTFRITIKNDEPDYYRLNFTYRNRVPVLVGYDDFYVEVDASNIRGKYTISGSSDHELIDEVKSLHANFGSLKAIKTLKGQYEKASTEGDQNSMKDAELMYQKAIEEKDEMIKEVILEGLENKAYLGAVELLYNNALRPDKHIDIFEKVSDTLNEKIPDASITKRFTTYVQTIQQTVKLQQNE
ncbi:MAG: DUF4369 domain-containing protein [Fulvivirga sp.]